MAGLKSWLGRLFKTDQTLAVDQPSSYQPVGSAAFGQDNNLLALRLYGSLRTQPGNLFFSPFSIRTVLAMAYAGASDDTAAQMKAALHFSQFPELLHLEFAEIIKRLNAAGGGLYEMAVADALFSQEGSPLKQEFLELVDQQYGGVLKPVDFRNNAEAVRAEINQWVEDKTRQRIQQIVPPDSLDREARLVLVNAVYFKGRWVLPFNKAYTREEPFYLEGGTTVTAQLMHQQREIRYVQKRGFQAVDLTYQGNDLSLLVLLPNKRDGLAALEKALTADTLRECVSDMTSCEVKLFLPRFKITWGVIDIRQPLMILGMKAAFDRTRANFSGINGLEPPDADALFISAVFHKAFVEVNEEGTEAAAATAAAMSRAMASPNYKPPAIPTFRADHPFLFAIRDRRSNAILFLGRVVNPQAK
jgi:serpin B